MIEQRDHSEVTDHIKAGIIDLINDLKAKDEIWGKLTEDQTLACDGIIKKMVLNAKEVDYIGQTFDLVKSFFDVIRDI